MSIVISHTNVRSLSANFADFKQYITDYNHDIAGVTETWLRPDFDAATVTIDGFNLIREDRVVRRGGGVGIYIKNSIKFKIVSSGCLDFVEYIWVELILNSKNILLGVLYRPPRSNLESFFDYFEESLSNFYTTYDNIICCGDFNINLLNINRNNAKQLEDIADIFNLTQYIQEPTRMADGSYSLLDLLYCNMPDVLSAGVADYQLSDHFPIFIKIPLVDESPPPVSFKYRPLKNINYDRFQADLESWPWENIFYLPGIEEKVNFLSLSILQLFDIHAPLKICKKRNKKYAPWLTDNVKLLQRLRNQALRRFKNTRQAEHYSYYKQLRNYTTAAIRAEKKAYLRQKFLNSSTKEKWSELKKLDIIKNKNNVIPGHLSNPNEINNFFINSVSSGQTPNPNLLDFYQHNVKPGILNQLEFNLVTEDDILKIIMNLKSKAFGSDALNITLIQLCCPYIIPFITHVINKCIETSYYPDSWKNANVLPLPKISQPTEFSHLRSISILPTFSKILEKILDGQIRSFLDRFNILPLKQSGFRPGFGCETAMSDVVDDVLKACDDGKISALILLDFTKAFDMLNHSILLSVLHYTGFGDRAIKLIKSFLTHRTQRVVIAECFSDSLSVTTGVPQGSILGPLLYTIYTGKFHETLNYCNYHLYADDTQIYCSFDTSDLNSVNTNINLDLKNIIETSKDHQLKINPSKSSITLFGNETLRNTVQNSLNIAINNVAIPYKSVSKSLGLLVDSDLRFREHIKLKVRKAYCTLKLIYNHRYSLTSDIKKMLCDTLVLSHFNHCDVVYGPCIDSAGSRRIQRMQNSCLRLIYGVRRTQRISHFLSNAGWLNMHNRRRLHFASFCLKILKFKAPSYLFSKIVFRNDIHSLNLRRNNIINIPRHRKEIFKRSFSYNFASCVNSLDARDVECSASVFKSKYKNRLFLSQ